MADEDRDRISIRDYFDSKLEALDRATATTAAQMERRLEGMNEFRDTLRDQASRLVTREEFALVQRSIEAEIRQLREFKVAVESKASQASVMVVAVFVVINLVLAIVGIFWR